MSAPLLHGPTAPLHVELDYKVHLPQVHGGAQGAPQEPAQVARLLLAVELYRLIKTNPEQQRVRFVWDSALADGAERRLNDMQARRYYSHVDPDGRGPNWHLRDLVPAWYDSRGMANSIESLNNNTDLPDDCLASLLNSPPHVDHILGRGWFGGQERIGIVCGPGYADNCWWIWVVLICHEK